MTDTGSHKPTELPYTRRCLGASQKSKKTWVDLCLSEEKSAGFSACLLNQFCPGVNSQGLYLVKLKFGGES